MKLAGFGLVIGVAGLLLGVEGLVISGGVWILTGLLVRTLVQPGRSSHALEAGVEAEVGTIEAGADGSPRLGVPGIFLVLASGLGSIAIGILGVGFPDDYGYLRWIPVVVGVLISLIGLIAIPVETGKVKPVAHQADPARKSERPGPVESRADGHGRRDPEERLAQLEDLRRQNLVTDEEYKAQRERILRSI